MTSRQGRSRKAVAAFVLAFAVCVATAQPPAAIVLSPDAGGLPPVGTAYIAGTSTGLAALRVAAADVTVTTFFLSGDITLDGEEIIIRRPNQTVTLAASSASCSCSDEDCPVLNGAGRSRILRVEAGSFILTRIGFGNGNATGSGGSVLFNRTLNSQGLATFETVCIRNSLATVVRLLRSVELLFARSRRMICHPYKTRSTEALSPS